MAVKTEREADAIERMTGTRPEIISENKNADAEKSEAEKKEAEIAAAAAAEIEAQKKEGQEGKEEGAPKEEKKSEEKPPVIVAEKELDDAAILEYLKKKGVNATSLEDLKPKEDPAVAAERKESQKLTFALENGIITRSKYNSYVADSANPQNVVYADFAADLKKDDPALTDSEIAEQFAEEFNINAEEGTSKYKTGQKKLNALAEKLMKEKHPEVYEIDSRYSQYETEFNSKKEHQNKILTGAPVYAKDVNDAFATHSKITISLSDKESYEVTIPDESINKLKTDFLDKDFSESQISGGYTKESISSAVKMALMEENFATIIKAVKEKALKDHAKGTMGIPPLGGLEDIKKEAKNFTDKEKKFLESRGISHQALQN